MTRRELREHVFNEIFASEFLPETHENADEQMELYFSHPMGDELDYPTVDISPEDRHEITDRAKAACRVFPEIDTILNDAAVGWSTGRMSRVDLAILRLGTYELLYDDSIPDSVAISEAVLLAKKFGGDESPSFINGILGTLQRGKKDDASGSADGTDKQ